MFRQLVTAAALTLPGVACAGGPAVDGAAQPSQPDSIFIEALNDNFYDARIHAVYNGGQRRSLGTIAGNGGRTQLALAWEPRALVFEILFILDGGAYVSYPVDVARGQLIAVRLPPNIDESGLFRRVSRN